MSGNTNIGILEGIRNFILQCPLLHDGRLNVDYLGFEATEYSIDGTPVQPVIKRYVDGGTVRQFNFVFSSIEIYGEDALNNLVNSGFYEDFAEWLEQSSKAGNLPEMSGGKTPLRIEALNTGYLFDSTTDKGLYHIQCRLIYQMD